jgi:hypothetical protein
VKEREGETVSNRYVKIDVALLLAGPKLLLTAQKTGPASSASKVERLQKAYVVVAG